MSVRGFGRACVFTILALSALLLSAVGGASALAQTMGPAGGAWSGPGRAPAPGPYAPYEQPPSRGGGVDGAAAVRMLQGRGFSNVTVLRQRGATILLEANGPRGERVQVVVDSASGAISGMKVIGFGDKRY